MTIGPFQAGVPGYFTVTTTSAVNNYGLVSLTIDPGDETGDLVFDVDPAAGNQTVAHLYRAAGLYAGKVTVTNKTAEISTSASSSLFVAVH